MYIQMLHCLMLERDQYFSITLPVLVLKNRCSIVTPIAYLLVSMIVSIPRMWELLAMVIYVCVHMYVYRSDYNYDL